MNDEKIRLQFHRKRLRRQHEDSETVVVDELGLKHGRCRADIAVINGHFVGYEIKSDKDSLRRLPEQINVYSAVFDRASVIVGEKHACAVKSLIPGWWGLILTTQGPRGGVTFTVERKASLNRSVDPFSVAQLLWRDEVAGVLEMLGAEKKTLRAPRKVLYHCLASEIDISELRRQVRMCLKARTGWRYPEPLSPSVGLSRPCAK
ncbi:MAG: sce7726 family protein [Desulfatiglandaceae bacterium]